MSASSNVAIKVSNVHKTFKLPHERQSSVKGLFIGIFRGKKSYEKQHVLKDISFEIKKGEFFGIVGRNGSGKSTLLKLLAGIYTPDSGHIQINGKLTPFIELGVGFNPELTGRENVFLNGALLGFNRKEMEALYEDIVEFAELEKFMDQKLKNYSSGMQVRLAFSIAIRAQSDILLLDEVLAVGDATFQSKCYEYFNELKQAGRTVIFVSHDLAALARFCDRSVLVDNGKILKEGKIKEVLDVYRDLLIPTEETVTNNVTKKKKLIEINDVDILNSSGEKVKKVRSTDALAVRVGLKHIKLDDSQSLNVAIGIYNGLYESDGVYVFGASTLLDKVLLKKHEQDILLNIDASVLRNGEYNIYVSVFGSSEEVFYDYKPSAAKFLVTDGPALTSRGALTTNHEWSTK